MGRRTGISELIGSGETLGDDDLDNLCDGHDWTEALTGG